MRSASSAEADSVMAMTPFKIHLKLDKKRKLKKDTCLLTRVKRHVSLYNNKKFLPNAR